MYFISGTIQFIIAKTADGLLVSICVNLMILPVIVYYYYEVPVYGVLLNIVVVPLMSVLLLALVGLGITGAFSDIFGIPAMACSYIAGIIFRCYEILCKLTDKLPYNTMCFGRPKIGWIIFYYVLLALMLIFTKKKRAVWAVYTLPFWVMLLIMPFFSKGLIVNMFDVGQGDGIYIKTPNNCNILIDSGSSSKKKVGDYIVKPGIKYYGAKRLDYVIVTHSDYDHYSGVMELLTAPDIEIGNFVLPAVNNPDDGYNELIKAADLKGCNIYKLQTGDRLVFDEVTFLCLNPEKKSYLLNRAVSLTNLGQYTGALKDLYRLNYEAPDDQNVSRVLAWALVCEGKYDAAVKIYNELLKGDVEADDLLNYGYSLWFSGHVDEAADCFHRFLKEADCEPDFILENEADLLREKGISEPEQQMMLYLL